MFRVEGSIAPCRVVSGQDVVCAITSVLQYLPEKETCNRLVQSYQPEPKIHISGSSYCGYLVTVDSIFHRTIPQFGLTNKTLGFEDRKLRTKLGVQTRDAKTNFYSTFSEVQPKLQRNAIFYDILVI